MAFGYYKSATLDHTQAGSGDSTDWPLTISITDADFKTVGNGGYVQNANGYDIRPYSDSGLTSALTFELVYYNATTGQLEMHVKIATLSVTVDVVLYLAFGDSGISTDGSSTATWSNNLSVVTHFADGSTLSVVDSTSNANDGTNNGATATTGVIDGAANFSGSTQYVALPDNSSTKPASAFAVSGWFKTSTNSLLALFTSYDQTLTEISGISFGVDIYTTRSQKLSLIIGNNVTAFTPLAVYGTTSVDDGNDHYFLLYSDGATGVSLFIDGGTNEANVDFGVFQNPGYTASNSVNWGRESTTGFGAGKYFVGDQDEMRLATAARTQSWGVADYNSQKSSSTFITWGSRTSVGGASVLKTWDGLAVASHKTHNGLAIASRKTINGLA